MHVIVPIEVDLHELVDVIPALVAGPDGGFPASRGGKRGCKEHYPKAICPIDHRDPPVGLKGEPLLRH